MQDGTDVHLTMFLWSLFNFQPLKPALSPTFKSERNPLLKFSLKEKEKSIKK